MNFPTLKPAYVTPLKGRFTTIKTGFRKVATDLGSSSKLLFRKTRIKAESIRLRKSYFAKREEGIRRREKESEIEAGKVGTGKKSGGNFLTDLGGSLLKKIMDTLGTFLVGWLVYNLPTIMTMAQNLITRLQSAGRVITGFFENIAGIFLNTGKIAGALLTNIVNLDFFDNSKRVRTAFSGLNNSFDNLHDTIKNGIDLFTKPLGGLPGEKEVPGTGTDYTDTSSAGAGAGAQGPRGAATRSLLDTIAYAEGTANAPNKGYNTLFGGGQVADLSKHPDRVVRSGGYASAAFGRYQFMPSTYANVMGGAMTPERQDAAAVKLIIRRLNAAGISVKNEQELDAFLQKEGLSKRVIKALSPEWASFPGNAYNQPTKPITNLQKEYQKRLKVQGATVPEAGPQPKQPQPIGQSSGWQLENSNGSPVKGYSTLRPHHSYQTASGGREVRDFTIFKDGKYINAPVPSPVSGKVNWAGYTSNGGNWVEISSSSGLVELGHFNRILVKAGQQISVGTILGLQGKTGNASGEHVHIQAKSNVIRDYVNSLASGTSPTGGMVEMPSLTPEDISNQPGQVESLPPVNPISNVVVIDDRPDSQPQPPPMVSDYSAGPMIMMIDKTKLLNNIIKNNILLELAYT
jgi:hypothetical protein